MKNILAIDIEDWYHTRDFNFEIERWPDFEERIENNTQNILDLLSKYDVKATFFVLGYVAQNHPELIKSISDNGHEIGSHGFWHKMVNEQSRDAFKNDIVTSKKILESITGKKVDKFRASTWSVTRENLWTFDIIREAGFLYDSSMQPFKTPLSGTTNIPLFPFKPVIKGKKTNIIEVPPTVLKVGKILLPFSGGLYFRLMPYCFIKTALKKINRKAPGMIYLHPWEFDTGQPVLKVPLHIKAAHYYGIKHTYKKLEKMLQAFDFAPMGEVINDFNIQDFSF